jgi:chitinase
LALVGGLGWAQANGAAAGRGAFPAHLFAPFTYVQSDPTFPLVKASNATGGKFFTLAFIKDRGDCKAAWDSGIPLSSGFYGAAIAKLRDAGGDVLISFGGAGGHELALSCSTVGELRRQYQAVVNRYHLTRIDFDIEGNTTLADTEATNRRNKAIAAMQQAAHDAGKTLTVQFTLAVDLNGLPAVQRRLLKNAVGNGVKIGVVNLMVMDYFDPDHLEMAQNAQDSAKAVFAQLHRIFPTKTPAQRWATIGLTPMIGENDDPDEVFTPDDADTLLGFARDKGVAFIGFWSSSRDRQCGGRASDQCSGVDQTKYEFAKTFVDF